MEPGSERWWDGVQWTDHRRPILYPRSPWTPLLGRPTVILRVDGVRRVRWLGGYWGGLNPWASIALGVFYTLVSLFLITIALAGAWSAERAVLIGILALLLLPACVVLFVDAHFGFVLRRPPHPS